MSGPLAPCGCLDGPDVWQPNLTWIIPDLAVGGRLPPERVAHLAGPLAVGAVIDLRSEDRDDAAHLARHGIRFLHLPTDDHGALAPADIRQGLAFAGAAGRAETRLLVHCEHGIGRSATLALCILVERGYAPLDALRLCKDRRAVFSPSPAQFECWAAWLEGWRRDRRPDWEVPEFDSLAAIAYRHLPGR